LAGVAVGKFLQDYKAEGEAEVKFSVSLWHFVALIALVFLALYIFKWR